MKTTTHVLAFLLLTVAVLSAGTPAIGTKLPDFSLKDYNDKAVTLSGHSSKKAVVMMFIATQCPVSNAYNDRMAKLADEFSSKGIQFIGVNSNKQESVEEIKKHSTEHNFNFPVVKDWNNLYADKIGATVTPEIFLMTPDLTLLYHGRIDDAARIERMTSQDLRTALEEILAGKNVSKTESKAFGCTIKKING